MLRTRAAALLVLVAGCGSPDKSMPASQQAPLPQDEAAGAKGGLPSDGAAPSEAAATAALPVTPTAPPKEAQKASESPSDDIGEGDAPKPESAAPKGGSGGGGKKRVFAAVVKGLQGSLTEEQVTKTVSTVKDSLQACFGNAEARLEVSLQISGGGVVGDAGIIRSEPSDPRKSECAAGRLGKLKFPPPGQQLKLELAIYLEPK